MSRAANTQAILRRVVAATWLTLLACAAHSISVTDVIHTTTGDVVQGNVVERFPGQEYHVETAQGTVVIPESDIDYIEKTAGDDSALFIFTDIVLLRSGVMIRGTIVEERQGEALTMSRLD